MPEDDNPLIELFLRLEARIDTMSNDFNMRLSRCEESIKWMIRLTEYFVLPLIGGILLVLMRSMLL